MNYLTTPFTLDFQANTLPSFSHQVNGMSTKTNAVKHALDCKVVSNIKDLENISGNLLIEPLFFKSHPEELATDDTATFEERLAAIRAYTGRKMLLCSEMTPLRWSGKKKEAIISEMAFVFSSCRYQAGLLEATGISVDKVVYEPTNAHLFFPADRKENWVVAIGSTIHVKNIDAILKIFEGLADVPDIQTVFIGSPIVWGNITFMKREKHFEQTFKSLEKIKAIADIYYPASAQAFVAYILSKAKYYLNFAYHETCCRTAMEAMLSGVGILAGKHPLFAEYPCVASGLTPAACVDQLKSMPAVDTAAIRDWAVKHVSYDAFQSAVMETLR